MPRNICDHLANLFIENILRVAMLPNTGQLALILAVTYLIIFFLLGSGVFNSIIEGPGVSTSTFIVPSRSVQTIGETIVTTMILFIGMAGAFLLYRSGKAVNPKTQGGLLAAGFTIIGIALILGFRLVGIKA
jgi:hypothetical protein